MTCFHKYKKESERTESRCLIETFKCKCGKTYERWEPLFDWKKELREATEKMKKKESEWI